MANFCLPKNLTQKFIALIKEHDPAELSQMTSAERRALFASIADEATAKELNTAFEKQLLLVNKKTAMENWVKRLTGITEPVRRDMISRVQRLDERILNPATEKQFLEDLAAQKLGVGVTEPQAETIMNLAKRLKTADKTVGKDGISEWGQARQKLASYLRDIGGTKRGFKAGLENLATVQRAIQTGLDISSAGRQAAPYVFTKEYWHAFNPKSLTNFFRSPAAVDSLEARMYSNPNWQTIERFRDKLGLTLFADRAAGREETFATKIMQKAPVLSNFERVFEAPLNQLRYERFSNTIDALQKAGIDITHDDKKLGDLAKTIAALTGRGDLKSASSALKASFFSPKFLKSRLDIITNPLTKSGAARKEALKGLGALAGMTLGLATTIKGLHQLNPNLPDVELNPLSSDFLKAKVGNTRIDLSFGFGTYIRVLAQLAANKSVNPITGATSQLNTGKPGSKTGLEVLTDFFRGKLSPGASLLADLINRKNAAGNQLTTPQEIGQRLLSMFQPLLSSDAIEAYKDASGQSSDFLIKNFSSPEGYKQGLLAGLASFVGIGVNTYGGSQSKIGQTFGVNFFSPAATKEFDRLQSTNNKPSLSDPTGNSAWTKLAQKLSQADYNQAVNSFEQKWSDNVNKLLSNGKYQQEPDDQKTKDLDYAKQAAQDAILSRFKLPKAPNNNQKTQQRHQSLDNLFR